MATDSVPALASGRRPVLQYISDGLAFLATRTNPATAPLPLSHTVLFSGIAATDLIVIMGGRRLVASRTSNHIATTRGQVRAIEI